MTKKIVALMLAMTFVCGILGGCGGNQDSAGSDDGALNITIMMSTTENGGTNTQVVDKMLELTNVNANVINAPTASYAEKLNATLASGNLPEIVYMSADQMNSWIEEGALLPMDDLIEQYGENIKKTITQEDRKELIYAKDNQLYGLPYILRLPAMSTMGIRRDWLEKLNLSAPTTIEELEAVLTAFKENGDVLGVDNVIPMAGNLSAFYMMFGISESGDNGLWTLDEDGNYISKYEHPNFKQCLETLQRFYAKGLIDPEYLTRNTDANAIYSLFNSGVAGSGFVYSTRLREITELLQANDPNAVFDYMAPITGINGEKKIPGRDIFGTRACLTIAAKGKEKECMEFLDWAYSEEGERLFNYGIEGVTYDMVDGAPVIKDEYNHGWVEIRKMGVVPTNMAYNRSLEAYNQCMFYGKEIEELEELELLTYKAYYENEPYVVAPLRSFSTETSLEKGTDVYSFLKEKEAKVILGQLSVDDFFKELEAAKANGLDQITKEMQEYWNTVQN